MIDYGTQFFVASSFHAIDGVPIRRSQLRVVVYLIILQGLTIESQGTHIDDFPTFG